MPIESIIRYCAPTLAGIKLGSLTAVAFETIEQLEREIKARNEMLNPRGIYFKVLKKFESKALIYVYRPSKLLETLGKNEIQVFLKKYGYIDFSIENCLNILQLNLQNDEFPHEIGVFLDYPLKDIKGFIKHKGANSKLVGYWKVYDDPISAEKIFNKYKKCTEIYCKMYAKGQCIDKLAVKC